MQLKEKELLWKNIQSEAQQLAICEPILANFLNVTLLEHKNLGSALSYILAKKLGDSIVPATAMQPFIQGVYSTDEDMLSDAVYDIYAVKSRDPTVKKYYTPLLYLKGFHALQAYRISHWLWCHNRYDLAVYYQNKISVVFGVDIHPAAYIGRGILLDHATGIVIGETAVVENNVSILQSVTLGGTGKSSGDRHPKIREWVMIGAGAIILGNIEVGKGAKIAAGSVVLRSVPFDTTVAGVPARIVGTKVDDPSYFYNRSNV